MLFMIDIIWIKDGTVVDISDNMPEFNNSPNYTVASKNEADFVLEVSPGFIKKHGIKIGDPVLWGN